MIKSDNIIQEGNPILKEVAKEITFPLSKSILDMAIDICNYLLISMDEEKSSELGIRPGIGLAAPQLASSIRMFGMIIEKDEEFIPTIIINPKIIAHSEQMCYLSAGEGCLSVDDEIRGFVPRYKKITAEAYNINGEKLKIVLKDFYAIVFQHEYDHLNGILFTEKLTTDIENLIAI